MVAQDARWIADAALSVQTSAKSAGWLPLTLLGHSSRIVYEGVIAVRSKNRHVGLPESADQLGGEYEDVIARSRHAGKFLDETKKSFSDLQADMRAFYAAHQEEFLGNSVSFARRWESDIGIFTAPGKRLLGTTITTHFRAGVDASVKISDVGPQFFAVAHAQGRALGMLCRLNGDLDLPAATIDYSRLGRLSDADQRVRKYLQDRYDAEFDIGTKLLLLMVESELNITDLALPLGEETHRDSVFRARVVSLFHTLRAVEGVLDANDQANSKGTASVRSLLRDSFMRRLLDEPQLNRLRNRCMHYEIRDESIRLDTARPMFGIVENLSPDDSFESLNEELKTVGTRLANALHDW